MVQRLRVSFIYGVDSKPRIATRDFMMQGASCLKQYLGWGVPDVKLERLIWTRRMGFPNKASLSIRGSLSIRVTSFQPTGGLLRQTRLTVSRANDFTGYHLKNFNYNTFVSHLMNLYDSMKLTMTTITVSQLRDATRNSNRNLSLNFPGVEWRTSFSVSENSQCHRSVHLRREKDLPQKENSYVKRTLTHISDKFMFSNIKQQFLG